MILRRIIILSIPGSVSESKLERSDGQDKSAPLLCPLQILFHHFLAIHTRSIILVSESLIQQLI